MTEELIILTSTALSIGFFHTLLGPDHYIPFVAMSKAGNWSVIKTSWITLLCGLGHVGSSVLLGLAGIGLGTAVSHLEFIESVRGNLAAWFLIAFGFTYMVWGFHRAYRNKTHSHLHIHSNGATHIHQHNHHVEHMHVHQDLVSPSITVPVTVASPGRLEKKDTVNLTPWILFTIFVFGPCEPLIPILMYPASYQSVGSLLLIVLVFSAITLLTMLTTVLLLRYGISLVAVSSLEHYTHALAGAAVLFCGVAIQFLGL